MLKRKLYWLAMGLALAPLTIANLTPATKSGDCADCGSNKVAPAAQIAPQATNNLFGWSQLIQEGARKPAERNASNSIVAPKADPIVVPSFKTGLDFSMIPQNYGDMKKYSSYHQAMFEFKYAPLLQTLQPMFQKYNPSLSSLPPYFAGAYYNAWGR